MATGYLILTGVPGAEAFWTPMDAIRRAIKRDECRVYIEHCQWHDEDFSTPWSKRNRPRSRQFVVRDYIHEQRSSHYTLEAAEKAAARWVRDMEPDFRQEENNG